MDIRYVPDVNGPVDVDVDIVHAGTSHAHVPGEKLIAEVIDMI